MLDPRYFRFYEQDGLRVPSVTTVLQLLPEPDFVKAWKERIGPEQYKIEMEGYGIRGTTIHAMCENHFAGANEPIPTDPTLKKFVEGFHYFIMAYKSMITPVDENGYVVEEQVFSPTIGYAGRFDLLLRMAGKLTLVDIKTSTGSKASIEQKKKWAMQLSAYTAQWNATHSEQIEQAMVVMLSDAKKTGLGEVVMIPMDDSTQEVDLRRAWNEFKAFLICFLMEYVPELATPERLFLISEHEICKKV